VPIPLYSESGEFLRMIEEIAAHDLVLMRKATVVRDRKGIDRRVYEIASVSAPLRGEAKRQAMDSYRGIDKYTYRECFESAASVCMLKRYNPRTDQFTKWPENRAVPA
jgi:hypothetical protein